MRIAIIHVVADRTEVLRRAKRRAEETGREVPTDILLKTLDTVPKSVAKLAPLVDYTICINNDGSEPFPCTEDMSWSTFTRQWAQTCRL